ncbi:hypothetical protein D8B26_000970 [Coccidioides posadasii str. Silveira]|uniref:uncharacterized protein n=1 Tax=Coccidioides posadasii (strain RMSCC 757 / Silveira) TaxID=443226 RepID=UPI001BF08495|nr:hypothetical protein D8B26_000970 [Coccidioides posadasii str. Silveira]
MTYVLDIRAPHIAFCRFSRLIHDNVELAPGDQNMKKSRKEKEKQRESHELGNKFLFPMSLRAVWPQQRGKEARAKNPTICWTSFLKGSSYHVTNHPVCTEYACM